MRLRLLFIAVLMLLMSSIDSLAQYRREPVDTVIGIVGVITRTNSEIVIDQPDGLSRRLFPNSVIKSVGKDKGNKVTEGIRYRVQVFSDNNRHSAKTNAEYRKKLIEQRMPGVPTYVTYDAPYWRVRVGDYHTAAEAQAALKQIKSKFPAFAGDVRMVKVRVNY